MHASRPDSNSHAPTWARWVAMARHIEPEVPKSLSANGLNFTEELHAIEAVVAGQGVGLFSDVLVERELANGALVKVLDLALPGFGFYLVHTPKHPRQRLIDEFAAWISSAR